MPTLTIQIPKPHKGQSQILQSARRFNALACGRRFGKTKLLQDRVIGPALAGYPVGWFAPGYKLMIEAWREIVATLQPVIRRKNTTERRIELITDGVLEFWTLEDADAGRSRKYKRIVVDEAGLVKNLTDIWHAALRPTLADYAGDGWLAGTPKGRNGFWELWELGGRDSEWASWQLPTWNNPHIPASEIAAMQASMPALLFDQEVKAAFVEDALTLFALDDIARAEQGALGQHAPIPGRMYLTTVDVGRRRDATIINTFDPSQMPYQRVAFERLERVPYPTIQQAIERRYRTYGGLVVVESNGIGDPVMENLAIPLHALEGFVTTARTKMQALQALQMLFEQSAIKALWDQRERAALISAAWDDDHTADEIMSLAIGAFILTQGDHGDQTVIYDERVSISSY